MNLIMIIVLCFLNLRIEDHFASYGRIFYETYESSRHIIYRAAMLLDRILSLLHSLRSHLHIPAPGESKAPPLPHPNPLPHHCHPNRRRCHRRDRRHPKVKVQCQEHSQNRPRRIRLVEEVIHLEVWTRLVHLRRHRQHLVRIHSVGPSICLETTHFLMVHSLWQVRVAILLQILQILARVRWGQNQNELITLYLIHPV